MRVFNRCRCELHADRVVGPSLLALMAAGALALALSDVSLAGSIGLWLLAALASWPAWRAHRRWDAIDLSVPQGVELRRRSDGRWSPAEWLGERRLGPLWLIELTVESRRRQIWLWSPGLSMNERRQLARCLEQMKPSDPPSA